VAGTGLGTDRLAHRLNCRLERKNRVLDEVVRQRHIVGFVKVGAQAMRLGIGLHLAQDVADDRTRVRLLAQIDQCHLDFRFPFDPFALEGIWDELDFAMLLDKAREHLALFRVRVSDGLGVQDRHDLAIEQNFPRLEHMLHALGERRIHDDVRIDRAGFELQEIEADNARFLFQDRMPGRFQFDDVDIDQTPIPPVMWRGIDQVPFASRGLKDTNEFAVLEFRPGALRQVQMGRVELQIHDALLSICAPRARLCSKGVAGTNQNKKPRRSETGGVG